MTASGSVRDEAAQDGAGRGWSVSIVAILSFGVGGFVVVIMGAVLALGIWSARQNTVDLLRDKARLATLLLTSQIEQHLEPAEHQLAYIADAVSRGRIEMKDSPGFRRFLEGAMAGAPQIRALAFIDGDHRLIGAQRGPDGIKIYMADYSGDPVVRDGLDAARSAEGAFWGRPLWRRRLNETILNLVQPLRRDGKFLGVVVAAVGTRALSSFLADVDKETGENAFILYGREHVLAHPYLILGWRDLSETKPVLPLAELHDPVLAAMWDPARRRPPFIRLDPPLQNHPVVVDGQTYVFIYRELAGYSDEPWVVGGYFHADVLGAQIDRLMIAALAGGGALLLAVAVAVLLGQRIAGPVARISAAADRIRRLDLDEIEDLPASRIRELDAQSAAFNTMLRALRWFEAYVPKTLVARLMRHGDAGSLTSDARNVTVMFTDIAGFSRMSEGKPAAEIAAFLNQHFALQAACIEAEGGTVDKFMGDSVMAFWGAPEKQKNRAARACRAALAIAAAVRTDNTARRAAGQEPVLVRIGIHSGRVTVGNIGAPGRVNYTIVGDAVNVGQRLEQLCKELCADAEDVAILISAATAADLDGGFDPVSVGRHRLRGRGEEVAVFRLA